MCMVGELETLYERLIAFIRKKFMENNDANYCSLRMELIMTAHDSNVEAIVKSGWLF